ncbi:MAG: 23S rRNA (pseudouridine(1915)-N(3))-methyltransferase RlmH [Fimbriimonadaceae bacterium]|nr:23S rRNA (pseudouridine(1915)-N(3))-methyltransferase RlmH [Chitinophagales bacterium]
MKIILLLTGKTNNKHIAVLMDDYHKRINKYCSFNITEIPDIKFSTATTPAIIREKEFIAQHKLVTQGSYVVLLDETGKQYTSKKFADFITQKQLANIKQLVFITGGAYGFSKSLYSITQEIMSLSLMTFPHQLVRLIFTEQLYRAFTILNNEQYHH